MEAVGQGPRPGGGRAIVDLAGGSPPCAADGQGSVVGAGITLFEADVTHQGALASLVPLLGAGGLDITAWASKLAAPGLPAVQEHFMRASGAAALGVAPGDDLILAAEMMAAHVAAEVGDLRTRLALPARLLAADCVVDWRDAARNALALLSAHSIYFGEVRGGAAAFSPMERGPEGKERRPPPDSFEVWWRWPRGRRTGNSPSTRTCCRGSPLALVALCREHERESAFKDVASSTQALRERDPAGELQYLVQCSPLSAVMWDHT